MTSPGPWTPRLAVPEPAPIATPAPDRLDPLLETLAQNGYACLPDFLSPDTTAALLAELYTQFQAGLAHAAGIGLGNNYRVLPTVRNDTILWLDPGNLAPAQAVYWQAMEDLRLRLNQRYFLGLTDCESHFAQYPPGGFYKRHLDVLRGKNRRRISSIFYLNFHWGRPDGGQLRLYLPGDQGETTVDILPLAGSLVVFDSQTIEHEVLPAGRQRASVAGWLRTA
jgi:SM-20-related protein